MQADAVYRRNTDGASHYFRFSVQAAFNRSKTFNDFLELNIQQVPCFGQHGVISLAAFDQLLAETLFQGFDLLADSRLRNEVECSGFRKAAGFNQIAEGFERFNVHRLKATTR